MKAIYTIGYAGLRLPEFISLLKLHGITIVVDVRSNPKSRFFVDFDAKTLSEFLSNDKIKYLHLPTEFGARQKNRQFYNREGYMDYSVFVKSPSFLCGVNILEERVSSGEKIALLCAEKDPLTCHRSIMITHNIEQYGFVPKHILHNGVIVSQSDIDSRLLDKFFPERNQVSIFQEDNLTLPAMVEMAYSKQNKEIGFKEENIDD